MAEKAIKVELSEEDRKILLAQKKILGDVLKPEKKNKGLGAMAAEMILSGKNTSITGALGSATKQKATESLQEKTNQIKEKFDPLNIINSMFGGGGFGSVMTAAVGKSMGRNEDDIRKFAKLSPGENKSDDSPSQMPSGGGGENTDTMLTQMLTYVIKISDDIRGLRDSSKNQEGLFKDQLKLDEKQLNLEEKQLDAANESRYEDMFGKKPTSVGADGKDKKETKEEKGFLASLLGFASALGMIVSGPFRAFAAILAFALSPLRALGKMLGGPLLRGLGALAAVAAPFAKQIGAKVIDGAKALGAKVAEKVPTLVAGAKAIGSKAVDGAKALGAKVAEKAPGIIEGVKTMGGKALEGAKSLGGKAMESVGLKAAATVPGALTPFGEVGAKRAAAAGAEAAGKEGVAAMIKKSIAKRVPKAVASAVGKSIPFLGAAIGVGFALSRLMDGDVVGAGLEAVSGIGSFATSIPATVALIAKDIYEDVYGIKPESDPLVGERLGIIQSETEAAVKAEFAGKVGEEEKKGGDKKEGATTGETKVPGAPELKDEKADANIAATQTAPVVTAPVAPPSPASKAEQTRLSAKEMYQSSTKEEESAKLKIEAFKKANPFDIKAKGDVESGYTPGKFSDPKKQKEYDALIDAQYDASDKKEKAQKSYQTADNTQEYKFNKAGQEVKNTNDTSNKKDILISRFGYKESDLLNADGQGYSISKIDTAYDKEVKKDLLSTEKTKTPEQASLKQVFDTPSSKVGKFQGDDPDAPNYDEDLAEFKREMAPLYDKTIPTKTTLNGKVIDDGKATPITSIAPTPASQKTMPNWEAALKDYEGSTPADNYESQYPGIKAKFRELAKNSKPRTDNFQSIESHEQVLITRAIGAIKDGKGKTSPVADANIAQGQGQELKSGPAGIGANQPAPTSKTDATIAPTQEKRKMPNWEAALKDYEYHTPANHLRNQFPGIEDKFRELAKNTPPDMDLPQTIEIHEKILVGRAMRELKNKQVDTPEAQRMREIESKPKLQPAQPSTGEKMTKQSNENTMAKTEAMTGGNNVNTSIVSAPKVTNATNVTNAPINVRNSENTFVRNQSRIHDF